MCRLTCWPNKHSISWGLTQLHLSSPLSQVCHGHSWLDPCQWPLILGYPSWTIWAVKRLPPTGYKKGSYHLRQTAAQVDWSLLGATLQSCPPTHCMWLSKFVSGHSAISTTMAHWKCWDSPSCPLCRAFHETTCHVLQCQDHLRISKWQQMIDELCSWLIQSDTNPDITHYLMLTLQSQGAAPFLLTAWDSCHSATQDQDLIVFLASWLAICCHFGNHLKHHSG